MATLITNKSEMFFIASTAQGDIFTCRFLRLNKPKNGHKIFKTKFLVDKIQCFYFDRMNLQGL